MFRLKSAILGNNAPAEPMPTVAEGEPAADFPSLAPTASSQFQDNTSQPMPHWMRELDRTGIGRHSRASSIVSTRTKFSTTTLQEDARSIDINVAGQYFRINRDGSRVTMDAPPPYSAPSDSDSILSIDSLGSTLPVSSHIQEIDDDEQASRNGTRTPRPSLSRRPSIASFKDHINARDPTEIDGISTARPNSLNHRASTATLVGSSRVAEVNEHDVHDDNVEGRRDIDSLDLQRPEDTNSPRASGSSLVLEIPDQAQMAAHRTYSLPSSVSLETDGVSTSSSPRSCQRKPLFSRISCSNHECRLQSSESSSDGVKNFLRRSSADHAAGSTDNNYMVTTRGVIGGSDSSLSTGVAVGSIDIDVGTSRSHSPLSMDTENEISMHYARMMRKLDYDHRKAMHLKDKELADMRVRLHEKDTVLRQQIRAKDFLIDDLKQRLNNLEECVESMLEKARNQVEDLWECRWKDRDFHLRERMRRIEDEAQRAMDQLRAERSSSGAEPTSLDTKE